jgi:hypothetical protein
MVERTRQPAYLQDAIGVLEPEINSAENGLPVEDAVNALEEHRETNPESSFSFRSGEELIRRLLNNGYLYKVNGKVKIT